MENITDFTSFREMNALWRQQNGPTGNGRLVWAQFLEERAHTLINTTPAQRVEIWENFIREKLLQHWNCALVGVSPHYRRKVRAFTTNQ